MKLVVGLDRLCTIVNALEEAGVDILFIEWDGKKLDISTSDPDQLAEILKMLCICVS
jgi:hypothetical protein